MERVRPYAAWILGILLATTGKADSPTAPATEDKAEKSAPVRQTRDVSAAATRLAVNTLLNDLWESSSESVLRKGGGVMTKATTSRADLMTVNYAYALLLLRHSHWDAAINTFTKVGKQSQDHSASDLGIATARIRSGKPEAALNYLLKAAKAPEPSILTIQSVAAFVTNYTMRPQHKVKRGAISELENALVPRLAPEMQEAYKNAANATREYIGKIPTFRDQMLVAARAMQTKMAQLQQQYAEKRKEQLALQQMMDSVGQQLNDAKVASRSVQAQYQGAILAAQQANSPFQVNQLVAQRNNELSKFELFIIDGERQLGIMSQKMGEMAVTIRQWDNEYRQLEANMKAEEKRVDDYLSQPPLPFDPQVLRDQLLSEFETTPPKTEEVKTVLK